MVVTNFHVVRGATSLEAVNSNGATLILEKVAAHPTGVDLAILKFRATDVPFLPLGQSTGKVQGERVIVIGNPTGLTGTVSDGLISAFRKDPDYIQITAPISPGSSGSPVMDETGKVIGVATWQRREGQNLNFAIPAETVVQAIDSIGSNKKPISLSPIVRHEIRQFKVHTDHVVLVAFSPDSRTILTGSFTGGDWGILNDSIGLWDAETGREIRPFDLTGIGSPFYRTTKFSPDGRYVISIYSKGKLCLWDVATGRVIRRLVSNIELDNEGSLNDAAFSSDGRYVAAAGDNTIVIWNVNTGEEFSHSRDAEEGSERASFSPDARYVVFGTEGVHDRSWLTIRDVATGHKIRKFAGNTYGLMDVWFSPDGHYVISSNTSKNNSIHLWDVATGREINRFAVARVVDELAFSPDSRQVLCATWGDSTMHLYDVKTGEDICHFTPQKMTVTSEGLPGGLNSVGISPNGRFAVSGHADGLIRLWDLNVD